MEQRLTGALEETTGGRRLRVRGVARFQKPLRREDRIRPGGAAKLFRRPLRDARCLLGRREGGLESPLLKSLPSLDEQILDAIEVEGGVAPQDEARIAFRGGLRL